MMAKCLLFLCILSGFVTASTSLSILLVQPFPSTSYHIWTMSLVRGLLQKNHHVHVVSIHETNINDDLAQNLTYAVFDDIMKEIHENDVNNLVEWMNYSVYYSAYFTYSWAISGCERVTQTKAAKELLELVKHNKFDVIVQDITLHQCLYGLWEVAKGKPSIVGLVPLGPAPWLKDYTGGSHYPSVRSYVYLDLARPATIWQRTLNVVYYVVDDIIRNFYFLPASERIAEQYIGHKIRSLHEIEKSINIVLINSHPAIDDGIPLPPNAIEIGGMHAQMQSGIGVSQKYSENIRKFLDGAENGAIVISLGTNVNWKNIGLDKLKAIVFALLKLKQRVLWKLDIDMPDTIPDNLMTVKWLPQNDVLNHKNVKAIWTHGGLFSMQEAIWKGVPMVAMPFCLDQRYNVARLVDKGIGIRLDFEALSTQSVLNALEEIVYNKSYTENMKRLSNEFRDRPLPPLDLAIWSIEYAVRNPNGSLVSPIRSQSWMEQNLIDVYAILLLTLVVTWSTVFCFLKMLYNYFCKSTVSKSRKEKQT